MNNQIASTTEYWMTSDLGVCAALLSVGKELVDLDRSQGRKVQFLFAKEPDLEQVVQEFWADRLVVNARTYFDNLKAIKSRLYSM